MSEPKYQPEKGTEDFVHLKVTEKNGQTLAEPVVEQYNTAVIEGVMKLAGIKGEIVHDPRTAKEQKEAAPKGLFRAKEGTLQTTDQYVARYKELFKEEPLNIAEGDLKKMVDQAEAKLPVDATATGEVDGGGSGTEDTFKVPTDKRGWYDLYTAHAGDQAKAYDDITVAEIRDVLGK